MTTRRGRIWLSIAVAAAVVSAAAVGAVWLAHRAPPAPALPAVDLAGADPAVAAAVTDAERRVRTVPQSAKGWGVLGMVLLANGYFSEAQTCLARAERLDPGDARWPYLQAGVNRWTNPDAGDELRRAVARCGDAPPAPRLRLAEWLLSRGRYEDAEAEFQRSLAAVPDNPWARLGLARVALDQGDPQAALTRLDQAADPAAAVRAVLPHAYHDLRARIYLRLGDSKTADAEAAAARALPEDPEPPDPFAAELEALAAGLQARMKIADRHIKAGRPAQALPLLQDLAADYPESDVVWLRLTQARQALGDLDGAERSARNAVRLAPTSVEAAYFLGLVLFQEGKDADAAGCFRRATELEPGFAPGYLSLGQCLDKQGDRSGAIAALRLAVRYAPQVAAAHRALGELLAAAGQKDEAANCLHDAIRLDPDDAKARQELGQLSAPSP